MNALRAYWSNEWNARKFPLTAPSSLSETRSWLVHHKNSYFTFTLNWILSTCFVTLPSCGHCHLWTNSSPVLTCSSIVSCHPQFPVPFLWCTSWAGPRTPSLCRGLSQTGLMETSWSISSDTMTRYVQWSHTYQQKVSTLVSQFDSSWLWGDVTTSLTKPSYLVTKWLWWDRCNINSMDWFYHKHVFNTNI